MTCKDCKHFTEGVPDSLRKKDSSNWGRYADGICHHRFPKGYVDREPPHLARAVGRCFQFEEREKDEQLEL